MEDTSLEEGEIVDEPHYTPLERPKNYSAVVDERPFGEIINDSESDGELPSSSPSDSDSDAQAAKKKRPKVVPKPKLRNNTRYKKYDIWSTKAQEDVLSQTLSSCDVTKKDRSRDVESYDYSLSYCVSRNNNKRTRDDRSNSTLRLHNKKDEEQNNPRHILDVAIHSSWQEIAKDIANKLCEEKEELIQTIVEVVGQEKALELFQKVRKIEAEGGMLIMNQTRRRTPGGVFFFLIKHDAELTAEQHDQIFGDQREKNKQEQKLKKKMRRDKMKAKIAAEKNNQKNLPELLTKAELCVQELVSSNDRSRKKTEHEDVVNPPPTPETDGQDTSGDSMEPINGPLNINQDNATRNIREYEDDFLNINVENEMDLF